MYYEQTVHLYGDYTIKFDVKMLFSLCIRMYLGN